MTRDVLVLRDARESARKCSLTPVRGLAGVRFAAYGPDRRVQADGRVLLHVGGEPLARGDAGRGLLLLDCAWRRVPALLRTVEGPYLLRRLPPLRTAYPRKSESFDDPTAGLASIEALYAALALLGAPDPELLVAYRWADEFLRANPDLPRTGDCGPR